MRVTRLKEVLKECGKPDSVARSQTRSGSIRNRRAGVRYSDVLVRKHTRRWTVD